jgi:hypothetical protein
MKKIIRITGFLLFILMTTIILSSCSGDKKGSCVVGTGITASCGDDFTSGQCSLINGSFYEEQTCSDLGFGSS